MGEDAVTNSRPEPVRLSLAVVIGPLPPPRHGAAVSNLAAIAALEAVGWQVHSIDTSPGTLTRSARYYLRRMARFASCVSSAIRIRRSGPGLVYCGLSGGAGLVLDALLVRLAVRGGSGRLILHHHNFTYIDRDSRWMRFFLWSCPAHAAHLLLCACMRERYCDRYEVPESSSFVVDNVTLRTSAGELSPALGPGDSDPSRVRVGFLGAISVEKGFDLFAEVQRRVLLLTGGESVTFECAGLIGDEASGRMVDEQPQLGYQGVLDSAGVSSFLARQSLLLFPSRYPNEAQPNVIIESLDAGVPVLATPRGCVSELLEPHLTRFVVEEKDLVERAVGTIALLLRETVVGEQLGAHARAQYDFILKRSQEQKAVWMGLTSTDEGVPA